MPKKPRIPVTIGVERAVRKFVAEDFSAVQIFRHLERLHKDGKLGDLPTRRTIERLVNELKSPADTSGRWTLDDSPPSVARLILDVQAIIAERTSGRAWITTGLAPWVGRVGSVAPMLPPYDIWILAREYRRAAESNNATLLQSLDALLAFRAWGVEGRERYLAALEKGILVEPPVWWLIRADTDAEYRQGLRYVSKDSKTGEEYSDPVPNSILDLVSSKGDD